MYKITINGKEYKTKYTTLCDRIGWLAPELKAKISHLNNQDKISIHFPFEESRLDGRSKEAKRLKWFSWSFIII